MKIALKKLTKNNDLIFVLIFVLAAVFYLFNIGFSDLWSDETYTKAMINCSLPEMFSRFRNDLHPPLYFIGLRLFTYLFGMGTITLRVFSVIAVLSTLLLTYVAGQRLFGKQGAIYFCLMILALPMLASFSHEARMYTWAAFSVTGVFIYSLLFMKTGKNRDLVFLFIFTLAAIYIHYYSMVAALVANAFVFIYILVTKNKKWMYHLAAMILAALLFLPWLSMFMVQVSKVEHAFWAPPVSISSILQCFVNPFAEKFWTTPYSVSLMVLIYSLTVFVISRSFSKSFSEYRMALWLSLCIFLGTLLVIIVISLVSQPILFFRYVMAMVVMLVVPVTILLVSLKARWLKIVLVSMILVLGIKVSISSSYFSYGPYKQAVEYITKTYPDIHKIVHISEITAGPMVEYSGSTNLSHYWLKAKMSNVDAFPEIHQYKQPCDFLKPGELFFMVNFNTLELNKENFDRVLAESQLISTDTVADNKVKSGNRILVYLLKYRGE